MASPTDTQPATADEPVEPLATPSPDSRSRLGRLRSASAAGARSLGRLAARSGRWALPRLPAALLVLVVALAGGVLGAELAPATTATIGPIQAKVRVVPSLKPGIRLLLPPAGQVDFATHIAPVAVEAQIAQVDLDGARSLINSPAQVRELGDTAGQTLRNAGIRAALKALAGAVLGALLLSVLVWRRTWHRTAQVAITLAGTLAVTATMAGITADPGKLDQPQFTGLLSQAPYIAGEVPNVIQRLESYRSGLADIVRSVTALYATTGQLSTTTPTDNSNVTTVLHVSDIHLNPLAYDLIDRLVAQFHVNVVVDTGDITTWGTPVESSMLSRIGELKVPYVFVRGNHDSDETEAAIRKNRNAIVLDDRVVQVAGLTIAGIGDPDFTPDGTTENPAPSSSGAPATPVATATGTASSAISVLAPPSSFAIHPTGTGAVLPGSEPTGTGTASPSPTTSAARPNPNATIGQTGPQLVNNQTLAGTIEHWDLAHATQPVQIAMVHEPYNLQPLDGLVPTIMAGHTHQRAYSLDPSGTRLMIEGSTGGAGITERGLARLADGHPLPLAASLVYYAKRGPQAGRIVAYDTITVGGFGLTSITLQRTTISPNEKPFVLRKPLIPATPAPTPSLPPEPSTSVTSRP